MKCKKCGFDGDKFVVSITGTMNLKWTGEGHINDAVKENKDLEFVPDADLEMVKCPKCNVVVYFSCNDYKKGTMKAVNLKRYAVTKTKALKSQKTISDGKKKAKSVEKK